MKFISSKYKQIGMVGLVLLFYLLMYPVNLKYFQSFRFVDEEEHMTIGYLITQGFKLYDDISTNHQPFNYILSAGVHLLTKPQNVFMLLQRHRQVLYAINILWGLGLAWRFGGKAVAAIIVYEVTKFVLLGNEFIAEAIVVYPWMMVNWYFLGHLSSKGKSMSKSWALAMGATCAFITMTLLPLAVPLGIIGMYWLVTKRLKINYFVTGAVIVVAASLLFVNADDYLRETIINNVEYAAPRLNRVKSEADLVAIAMYPMLWLQERGGMGSWVIAIAVIWLGTSVYFMTKKNWRMLAQIGMLYLIWIATNLRIVRTGVSYYQGFHLLPWWISGMTGAIYFIYRLRRKAKWLSMIGAGIILAQLVVWVADRDNPARERVNPQEENYISYTPVIEAAEAIDQHKQGGDTMIAVPDDAILHWLTGLPPASSQVTYYEWQYYPPRQQNHFNQLMESKLPTFIQLSNDESSAFTKRLRPLVDTSYEKIFENPDVYRLKTRGSE